jgi:hypothetical protein
MDKKWITVIIAVIGLFAGGASYAINLQIGDNTVITDNSKNEETTNNFLNQFIPDDIVDRAQLSFTCTQDVIPESHKEACADWNSP